jgi:flagellar basal body-associated protein FliL
MTEERAPRPALFIALLLVVFLVAAALWVPRWWDNRLYRETEALTGVGSVVQTGGVTAARGKIDPGKSSKQVVQLVGRPSFAVGTEGSSTHDIWTYYYSDGTMTVNLTDGIVQRISVAYGPPKIPTSRRP